MENVFSLAPEKKGLITYSVEMNDSQIEEKYNDSPETIKLAKENNKKVGYGDLCFLMTTSFDETVKVLQGKSSNHIRFRGFHTYLIDPYYKFKFKSVQVMQRLKPAETTDMFRLIKEQTNVSQTTIIRKNLNNRNAFVDLHKYYSLLIGKQANIKTKSDIRLFLEILFSSISSPDFESYYNKILLIPVDFHDDLEFSDLMDYKNMDLLSLIFSGLYLDYEYMKTLDIQFVFSGKGGIVTFNPSVMDFSEFRLKKDLIIKNINIIKNVEEDDDTYMSNAEDEYVEEYIEDMAEDLGVTDKAEIAKLSEIKADIKSGSSIDDIESDQANLIKLAEIKSKAQGMVIKELTPKERRYKEIALTTKLEGKSLSEIRTKARENKLDIKVHDDVTSLDPKIKESTMANFSSGYNEKLKAADEINNVLAFSENKSIPLYVNRYKNVDKSTHTDLIEEKQITFRDPDGTNHTTSFYTPIMHDDIIYLNGTEKLLLNQIIVNPITKPSPDEVIITTAYNKAFIRRYNDKISPLLDMIIKGLKTSVDKKLTKAEIRFGNAIDSKKYVPPIMYTGLGNDIVSIREKGIFITFNEDNMFNEIKKRFTKYNHQSDVELPFAIIDTKDGIELHCINIETDGISIITFNDYNEKSGSEHTFASERLDNHMMDIFEEHFPEVHSTIKSKTPGKRLAYTSIKILRRDVPLGVVLLYLIGMTNLFEKLDSKYRVITKNTDEDGEVIASRKPRIEKSDQGIIELSDAWIVYDKHEETALIFNGLMSADLSSISLEGISSDRSELAIMMEEFVDDSNYALYLENYHELLIDPRSKEILDDNNIPSDFIGVLLYCNMLLTTNIEVKDTSLSVARLRRNEIISDIQYKVMADAYADWRVARKRKSNMPFSIKKTAVIDKIQELPTMKELSGLSPLQVAEDKASVSTKGFSGVNLDQAHGKERRGYDKSFSGILCAPSPFGPSMGIVRSLTINPKIKSLRGTFDVTPEDDKESIPGASMIGIAEAHTPLASEHDSAPRTAMAVGQMKHRRGVENAAPLIMTYGYDEVFPKEKDGQFNIVVKKPGKITGMENGVLLVKYNDGTKDAFTLNNIKKNAEKNFYVNNDMTVVDKKTFKAGDVIAYNKNFYKEMPDGQVIVASGVMANVAIASDQNLHEDSILPTMRFAKKCKSKIVKIKQAIFNNETILLEALNIGDEVEANKALASFREFTNDPIVDKFLSDVVKDQDTMQEYGVQKIKASYTGKIIDIRIYHTADLSEYDKSLQQYIKGIRKQKQAKFDLIEENSQDKYYALKNTESAETSKPYKGKINGKAINEELKEVLIEYYIEFDNYLPQGDKITCYAPLKGIVTKIVTDDIFTERGEPVDLLFSQISIEAREVYSPKIVLPYSKAIVALKKKNKKLLDANLDIIKKYIK
jgi:preprotein translocase subunit YajC